MKAIGPVKKFIRELIHARNEVFFVILFGVCSVVISKLFVDEFQLTSGGLYALVFVGLLLTTYLIYQSNFSQVHENKKISSFSKITFAIMSIVAIVCIDLLAAVAHHLVEEFEPYLGGGWLVALIVSLFVVAFILLESVKHKAKHVRFGLTTNKKEDDFGLIITLSLPPKVFLPGFSDELLRNLNGWTIGQICGRIREVKKSMQAEERRINGELSQESKLKISGEIVGENLKRLPIGNIAMYFLALEWFLNKTTTTRRLHIIASKSIDGVPVPEGSDKFLDDAIKIAEHFGLNPESSVIPFENPKDIYREVSNILMQESWYLRPAAVDLTGGNKQSTFAGGVATVHEDKCTVLYVDTNTMEAKTWDPRAGNGVHEPDAYQ